MSTQTTNIGLTKPAAGEYMSRIEYTTNLDIIDDAIKEANESTAIVSNGDTHIAIPAYRYVYVRNHSTLVEGMYVATEDIASNATLSSSNLSMLTTGGLNDVMEHLHYVNTSDSITSLSNVPLNAQGRCKLDASISPTGTTTSLSFCCYGSPLYRVIRAEHTNQNRSYIITMDNGTWKPYWFMLTRTFLFDDTDTNETFYNKISSIQTDSPINFVASANAMSLMTGGLIANKATGILTRAASGTYTFLARYGTVGVISFTLINPSSSSIGTLSYSDNCGVSFKYVQITKSSSKSFTLANSTRAIIYFIGTIAGVTGQITVNVSSAGTVFQSGTVGASITVTTSTNTLTIANGNSSNAIYMHAMVLNGSVTEVTA